MGTLYEKILRPILFRDDAEHAHERAIAWLHLFSHFKPLVKLMEKQNAPRHAEAIKLFGLEFPNAVGLAAGFDKNAVCWHALPALGFGHVEVGTVTYHEQPGNPRPRIERVPQEEAVFNHMGFPSDGAERVANRLTKQFLHRRKRRVPLGINIGKSKVCSIENAASDYIASFNRLADFADYFTINISCSNTPDLRCLQEVGRLNDLLSELRRVNLERAKKLGKPRIPMLVKISPDLSFRQIDDIIGVVDAQEFDGIIATNTTITRPGKLAEHNAAGALSGRPLNPLSVEVVRYIHLATGGRLPIIGSGGIMDEEAAGRLMDAGASLVQIYTGMIYRGPFFAREIAQALVWHNSLEWI